jgi:hypothetical protein
LAAPLKDSFGPEIPRRIGEAIAAVDFRFPVQAFLTDALDAYEALELTPRARHIAIALRRHLPADYEEAIDLLLASVGPRTDGVELSGMAAFFYVDLRIRFVKSGGGTSPEGLQGRELGLDHGERASVSKLISLRQQTTGRTIPASTSSKRSSTARPARWDPSPSIEERSARPSGSTGTDRSPS